MATFEHRKGRWRARVRRRGQKPLSRTFSRKLDAERWAHKTEEEIHAGTYMDRRAAERTTVAWLCDWYRATVVPSRGPDTTDEYRLNTLEEHLGDLTAAGAQPWDFVNYAKRRLKEGVSSDTVRRELDTAGDVFTSASTLGAVKLPANPVALARKIITKLRILKAPVERTRRLNPGEEEALLGTKTKATTQIQAMVGFALETAMRRGEICLMRRDDVDHQRRTLRIWHSKTDWKTGKAGRTIPLSPKALAVLKALPSRLDGTVWGVGDPHTVTRAFARLCRQAKVKGLRFHDLRHEATSRLFEKGYKSEEVATFTGHRDWASLKRYTHPDPEKIAARMG